MAISCRTCGNQNPDGATACQYCGAQLGAAPASAGGPVSPSAEGPTQVVAAIPPPGSSAGGAPASNQVGQGYGQAAGYGQSYGASQPSGYDQGGYGAQGTGFGPSYGAGGAVTAAKDPQTGLLLELIGIFGFLGIGWLWAGETAIGMALLIGFWVFLGIEIFLSIFLIGLCLLPLNLIIPIVSAFLLQKRLKERQSLGVGRAQPF